MNAALTDGKQPGYVELRFDHVPSPMIRAELKAARFRWNPTDKCWWGERKNLPARYVPIHDYKRDDMTVAGSVDEPSLEDLVENILNQVRSDREGDDESVPPTVNEVFIR